MQRYIGNSSGLSYIEGFGCELLKQRMVEGICGIVYELLKKLKWVVSLGMNTMGVCECLPTAGKNLQYEDSQILMGTFFVLWCVTDCFSNPAVGFELRGGAGTPTACKMGTRNRSRRKCR